MQEVLVSVSGVRDCVSPTNKKSSYCSKESILHTILFMALLKNTILMSFLINLLHD